MRKSDVICSCCGAGFRRLELSSQPGKKGEYRCPADRRVAKQLTERPLATSRDTPTLDRHGLNLRPMPPALMPEPKSALR